MLKNRETNKELFVVSIQLLPTEQARKEGVEDPTAKFEEAHSEAKGKAASAGGDDDDLD